MTAILAKPCPTCGALVPVVEGPVAPELDAVIMAVCSYYNVTRAQLIGPDRTRRITYMRAMAMVLCREQDATLTAIGIAFNRHHGTVLYALRTFAEAVKEDGAGDAAQDLIELRTRLARA
jgi:chromosomal replication initiation ATPase DnaA